MASITSRSSTFNPMEENPEDAIITEEREELMVSLCGGNPTRRTAHFLKPSVTSIKGPVFHLPPGTFLSPPSTTPNSIDLPLKVEFGGCRDPLQMWKSWFDRMHSLHQSTWKKAGIYEAIVNTTYQIRIDEEIVMGLAGKWCFDTNTFVFDWGEGTITLEDVMVLGGFSVLGNSVLRPLETRELVEINEKLMEGRREIIRGKAHKAVQREWAKLFMESGSDIEHEAFLVLWLSRHIFPNGWNLISKNVLSIAIHLARGTRIALAPAVLSWIYRDLRLLKNAIFSKKKRNVGLKLWAPMQIVQIWAWERFPTLTPQPNLLKPGEPRMAKWNKVKKQKNIENVGLALSSSGEYFQWRPYAISEKNWVFPKFYKESEERVSVCLGMDEDFESFARFVRPCELEGLDCLERYLPHRVAMQFGMDQDLPGLVAHPNGTPEIASESYTRPIKERLYVPSRLFKSGVTTRYLKWWKQSKLAQKDVVNGAKAGKSIGEILRKPPKNPKGKNVEKLALGTPPKRKRVKPMKSGGKDEKSITKSPVNWFQIPKRMNVENDEAEDAIITEEREELMVSLSGGNPTRRTAHFLKPSVTSIKGPVFHLPSGAFRSPTSTTTPNVFDPPLKVEFKGCRDPVRTWKSWFNRMRSLHQSTWKKAGINEAIVNSTYQIRVDKDIVMGFAQKWCSDTNTFVFDWGEGTITLEDVLVLGGYSVLGDSVLRPLETRELIEIDEKLMEGRREIIRSKANKAGQSEWVRLFMDSGSEIEHEAFLVLWLSRHVFSCTYNVINRNVHNIAIHLARGTRIAIGPAVLSWLYRDLRLLKNAIFSKNKRKVGLNLWSPMQMVQIWAWERYPSLSPQPNSLKPGEPRMARWSSMKKKNIENVGLALNSARDNFQWRPYANSEKNWEFPKLYKEREEWVSVCLGMDEYFESFARFLRPSELVGLDCLERYFPHRVAMQFGMDQDLPGVVAGFNETPEIAWENYSRPIKDGRIYVPSRLFKSDVTARYLEWWEQSNLSQKDAVKGAKEKNSITESPRKLPEDPKGKSVENDALGTPPKRKRVNAAKSGRTDEKRITKSPGKLLQIPKGMNVENDALHIPPKRKRVKGVQPVGKDKHRIEDSSGNRISGDGKCSPQPKPQIPSSLTADNGSGKMMDPPVELVKNTVRGEAMMGGSHRPSENASENSVGIPRDDGVSVASNGGNIKTQSTIDISGVEVRTSKLEKVFAQMKAEKLCVRSV